MMLFEKRQEVLQRRRLTHHRDCSSCEEETEGWPEHRVGSNLRTVVTPRRIIVLKSH